MAQETLAKTEAATESGLAQFFDEFREVVGEPEIREIKSAMRALASLFEESVKHDSTIKFLKEFGPFLNGIEIDQQIVEEVRKLQKLSSPWAIYAVLNLLGKSEDPNFLAAVRFSHFAVIDDREVSVNNLAQRFKATIETGFPWQNKVTKFMDSRMEPVRKAVTQIETLPVLKLEDELIEEKSEIPAIIELEEAELSDGKLNLTDEMRTFLGNQVDNRPFIIVKVKIPGNSNRSLVLMAANHQYLDGVPAAYHFNQAIGRSTAESEKQELGLSDQLEQATLGESQLYRVETVAMESQQVKLLNQLYERIIDKNDFYISYFDFLQLVLLANFGVNGKNIKGGVLGFNPDPTKQLDHFDVGNAQALLNELLEPSNNSSEIISPYLKRSARGNRINLYRQEKSNMNVLAQLTQLPAALAVRLNEFAKKVNLDRAISGQVMVSVVPSRIGNLELSGMGGPALTEYQDVAVTASVDFSDEANAEAKSITLRIKMRKKK